MLTDIRIFSSDIVWQNIFTDLNATLVSDEKLADVNIDNLSLTQPLTLLELKSVILGAVDNSKILFDIFGKNVSLAANQQQIVILLYKTGGLSMADLKNALGVKAGVVSHIIDAAIYQLRQTFGRDFIEYNQGIYSIGRI